MADNVGYTPGTGATVAADEIAGVLHQRVKLGIGDDGVAVDVSATNPLPVDIGAGGVVEVTDPAAELILTRMLNYLNSPVGYDKSLQRQRGTVLVESGTVTTVTTVTSVTNMASIGGIQGQIGVYGQNLAAWAALVRARIT
jgi:hypothetical protein